MSDKQRELLKNMAAMQKLREEAKKLVDSLRKKCKYAIRRNASTKRRGKEVRFFPRHTQGPMSNHSKFLIQDGYRTLVTSLNLFGGKSQPTTTPSTTEQPVALNVFAPVDKPEKHTVKL